MQLTALTFSWNLLKCSLRPCPGWLCFVWACVCFFRAFYTESGRRNAQKTWPRDPLASFQIRHDQASRSAINDQRSHLPS